MRDTAPSRARALQGDCWIGNVELGDTAAGESVGVGLIGDDIDVDAFACDRAGVGTCGFADQAVAQIADDARDPAPIVIRRYGTDVAPILEEIACRQAEIRLTHHRTPLKRRAAPDCPKRPPICDVGPAKSDR